MRAPAALDVAGWVEHAFGAWHVQPVPERSLSGFALMLGLRGTTDDLVHHTITFPSDYDAGFDDVCVRSRIVASGRRMPADLARLTGAVDGAICGAPHGRSGTLGRPGPVVRVVRGVYRVGGTAHPGGGLALVALGGRVVADLIGPA